MLEPPAYASNRRGNRPRRAGRLIAAGLLVTAVVASSSNRAAAAVGDQLWRDRFDGAAGDDDRATALVTSPDGTKVLVTGQAIMDSARGFDVVTIAYAAQTGEQLWTAAYAGPGIGTDVPTDIAISPDGSRVVVTGRTYVSGLANNDYVTIAYDAATGAQQWLSTYDGPDHGADMATDVDFSPDGTKVFVNGQTGNAAGFGVENSSALAYDAATGVQLWVRHLTAPDGSQAFMHPIAAGGTRVFVATAIEMHRPNGQPMDFDYRIIAYRASTGRKVWERHFGYRGRDTVWGMTAAGGRVFVTGVAGEADTGDTLGPIATVAYEGATGTKLWAARYDYPSYPGAGNRIDSNPVDLLTSPDGNTVYLTGTTDLALTYDVRSDSAYVTLAYDARTGAQRWVSLFDGFVRDLSPYSEEIPTGIGVGSNGATVFVTGSTHIGSSFSESAYATVAYDAVDGTQVWTAAYPGQGLNTEDYAVGVAPTVAGVVVTGSSESEAGTVGEGPMDYVTIAYEA